MHRLRARYTFGFSLIELMVVIAIIAALVALSAPAYSKYIFKTKFSNLLTLTDAAFKKSFEYAMQHGVYGSFDQVGYSSSSPVADFDSDLAYIIMNDYNLTNNGSSCGQDGVIVFQYNSPTPLGGDRLWVYIDYFNINGVIKKVCRYEYNTSIGGDLATDDLISGCVNNAVDNWSSWSDGINAATCL